MAVNKLNFNLILNRLMLFIAIGVMAHIVFVLTTTEQATLQQLSGISVWHLLGIMVCMILPWIGTATRMWIWAGFLGERISYLDAIRVVITSDVASALSPTAVGGTPIRAALLINRGMDKGNVGYILAYSIIEDLVYYATGVIIAIFFAREMLINAIVSIGNGLWHSRLYIAIGLFLIVAYRVLRSRKMIPDSWSLAALLPTRWQTAWTSVRQKIKDTISTMGINFHRAWATGKREMLYSICVLFLQWMSKMTVLVLLLDAFGLNFDIVSVYLKQWIIFILMLVVPTPGASGGAEASFLLIMGNSVPRDITFLVVSVWRFFTYYFVLLMSVLFYFTLTYVFKIKEEI
jgi:glycosyltransferase 2 family protein